MISCIKNTKTPLIAVYGANGWIGTLFVNYLLSQKVDIYVGHAKGDSEQDFIAELKQIKPTHVISFIRRKTSKDIDQDVKDNLYAPLTMADICEYLGIHMTYIGLITKEINEETAVKQYTDRLIRKYNILHFKINKPISSDLHSSGLLHKLTSLKELINPNKEAITVLDDFFPIWLDLMKHYKTGEYNCVNPGTITNQEILTEYRKIINPEHPQLVNPLDTEPLQDSVDISKILKRYPYIPNIQLSVKMILTKIKKKNTTK